MADRIPMGPLTEKVSAQGLQFLVIGGVPYTVGAIFYVWRRVPLPPCNLAFVCISRIDALFCGFVFVAVIAFLLLIRMESGSYNILSLF
jgi:predicted membrane channel-forming protein YqfA (hemolysin III family)